MTLVRIDRVGPREIDCALADGEGLIVDVSALRPDAVVELVSGVSVLAVRDARSASLDRIEVARSVFEQHAHALTVVVFVTEPSVEHARTLSAAPARVRVATIRVRSKRLRAIDVAVASASALAGALTLYEAVASWSYASAERSAMCVVIALAGLSMGVAWVFAARRRERLGVRWMAAAVIAALLAVIPFVAGARVVTIGAAWPVDVGYELRASALWSEECDAVASRQRTEAERRLAALPPPRWSQRLFPLCVSRPSSEQRFELVPEALVRGLGLESVSLCARTAPEATRCVLDMHAAARVRGESRVALDPSPHSVAPTVVRDGRIEPRDIEWFASVLRSLRPMRPRLTYVDRFALRYELRPGLALEWNVEGDAPMLAPSVAPPASSADWSLLSSNAYLCRRCEGIELFGLAPLRALADRATLPHDDQSHRILARDERHAIYEVTTEQLDRGAADAAVFQPLTQHVKLVRVTRRRPAASPFDPPSPVRFDDAVGFARCPASAGDGWRLSRVFGVPAGAGVTLVPPHSRERVGSWTSTSEPGAERYAVLCHPDLSPHFGHEQVRPVEVLVGSIAAQTPSRTALLVPRRDAAGTLVFDLRFALHERSD
jgi:hypothetical protein